MLETSNFVHGSALRSLSLVTSECSLSGRGHGHVSNFYIVDLENFATACRGYTGDMKLKTETDTDFIEHTWAELLNKL